MATCPPAAPAAVSSPASDACVVSALDLEYQAAVKRNDAAAMERILHPQFVLIRGDGQVITREALLEDARGQATVYEQQDEDPGTQTVRVWGDTAVVTARLWIKGHDGARTFDRRLWFSDTYVRTASGWRYAFAQVGQDVSPKKT